VAVLSARAGLDVELFARGRVHLELIAGDLAAAVVQLAVGGAGDEVVRRARGEGDAALCALEARGVVALVTGDDEARVGAAVDQPAAPGAEDAVVLEVASGVQRLACASSQHRFERMDPVVHLTWPAR